MILVKLNLLRNCLNTMKVTSNSKPKVVLLVEDDAALSAVTAARLKKRGFDVLTALCGEEAVSIARNAQHIDLILMDISLGQGIDGIEAARQIFRERYLPILFLSGHTEAAIVTEAEAVSPYGFVAKGTDFSVFLAAIHVAIRLYDAYIELQQQENFNSQYGIGCGSFRNANP